MYSILPHHRSCFQNSHPLLSPGKLNFTAVSHVVEHVLLQILVLYSVQWLQLEGKVLSVTTSADVWLAGSRLLCSAVAVDQLMYGNFIWLVKLMRPPLEVWELNGLGPAMPIADLDCLITIRWGIWLHCSYVIFSFLQR